MNAAYGETLADGLQAEIDNGKQAVCGRYQEVLQAVSSEESRYVFSAEHLALYKSYQKSLFIQPPHVFLSTDDSD